mmetsp:Transcript_51450/g.94179  ORF Transcript_51450/g.94179 Transcript_51450/m.94179 type:complete len:95 (-) Transcript_51450:44-328(-)
MYKCTSPAKDIARRQEHLHTQMHTCRCSNRHTHSCALQGILRLLILRHFLALPPPQHPQDFALSSSSGGSPPEPAAPVGLVTGLGTCSTPNSFS